MRILFNNLLDEASLIASSSIPGFGVDNLWDTRVSRMFRAISGTEWIQIDLGLTRTVSSFSMVGHNIHSATLQASTTSNFAMVDFEHVIDVQPYMTFSVFNNQSFRYWRVQLESIGSVQIGRIGIGLYVSLPYLDPAMEIPKRSTVDVGFSRTQQSYKNAGIIYRAFQLNLPYLELEERQAVEEGWENSNGDPVFVDLSEIPNEIPLYGLVNPAEIGMSYDATRRQHALSLEITEVF